jgi:hypothetical protein
MLGATGRQAYDVSGNGIHLPSVGAATFATQFGVMSAADTGAANQYFTAAHNRLPVGATDHFTLLGWENSGYTSLACVAGFGQDPGGASWNAVTGSHRMLLKFSNNYYFWGMNADWDTGIAYPASASSWTQWAFVFDGTTLCLCVDGKIRATRSGMPANTATAGSYAVIGAQHPSAANCDFNAGALAIYNRALTSAELAEFARVGFPGMMRRVSRTILVGGESAEAATRPDLMLLLGVS